MATTSKRYAAVLVPLGRNEDLSGNLHDLAIVAERRAEPAASHADLKKRLKAEYLPPRFKYRTGRGHGL